MPKRSTNASSEGHRRYTGWQAPAIGILSSIGLSLAVLAVIAVLTVESETFEQISRVKWWMPLIAVGIVGTRVLSGSWRLHFIAQNRLSWTGALRAQLAWDFFSNVTPSTIGGGPVVPAYIAHDSKIPLGDATAMMLFAMLLDHIWFAFAIAILLGASLFMEAIPASLGTIGDITFLLYFVLFLAWVLLFGYTTLVRPILLTRLIDRIFRLPLLRRLRSKAQTVLLQLREHASTLRSQPVHFFIKGFLLTFLTWIARYALVVVILYGFYTNVDQLLALVRTLAMMLGALVMPTPGGAGGIEAIFALMVGPLIPDSVLVPALLLWRLLGYYLFIALGAYLTVHHVQRALMKRASAD